MKLLMLALIAVPLRAGMIQVDCEHPNTAAQVSCPFMVTVPESTLQREHPQSSYAFDDANSLIGYLDPWRPGKLIVWAPLAQPWEPHVSEPSYAPPAVPPPTTPNEEPPYVPPVVPPATTPNEEPPYAPPVVPRPTTPNEEPPYVPPVVPPPTTPNQYPSVPDVPGIPEAGCHLVSLWAVGIVSLWRCCR